MSDLKHSATRRQLLTGTVTAAGAAALGCSGASAATEAAPIGPIETLYREWCRRNAYCDTLPDTTDEDTYQQVDWCNDVAREAMELTPNGDREWAALMMLALYFSAVDDEHPELWEFCASKMPDLQHPLD